MLRENFEITPPSPICSHCGETVASRVIETSTGWQIERSCACISQRSRYFPNKLGATIAMITARAV